MQARQKAGALRLGRSRTSVSRIRIAASTISVLLRARSATANGPAVASSISALMADNRTDAGNTVDVKRLQFIWLILLLTVLCGCAARKPVSAPTLAARHCPEGYELHKAMYQGQLIDICTRPDPVAGML